MGKNPLIEQARKRLLALMRAPKEDRDAQRRHENGIASDVAITPSGVPADPMEFQNWSIRRHSQARAPRMSISRKEMPALSDDIALLSDHLADLEIRHTGIRDLTPLTPLENLESLKLLASPIADLSPLARLPKLTRLELAGLPDAALASLPDLPHLTHLFLPFGPTQTLNPRAVLPKLQTLKFGSYPGPHVLAEKPDLRRLDAGNIGADLTPLASLTKLEHLHLRTTASNLAPLSELVRVQNLDLTADTASDLAPLSNLTGLEHLQLSAPNATDLSPLGTLANLTILNAAACDATSCLDWIATCTALTNASFRLTSDASVSALAPLSLNRLFLRLEGPSDLAALSELTQLTSLMIVAPFSDAPCVLPPLPRSLTSLALFGPGFRALAGTETSHRLEKVSLRDTQISDLSALKGLPHLFQLDLSTSPIASLSVLKTLPAFTDGSDNAYQLFLQDCPILDAYPFLKPLAAATRQRDGHDAANTLARAVLRI